ncbi:MAG: single-stranded DNA-binding protein [Bacteroidota bacterium]
MNQLRNRVQLIGHLGKEIDYKELDDGNAIARASIVTKEVHKDAAGERVVELQWHNLVGWGAVANIMQVLLKKGKEVAIQGKLQHRTYEDKEGIKRFVSEVVIQEFMLL